jgi:hypothetical protein
MKDVGVAPMRGVRAFAGRRPFRSSSGSVVLHRSS